MEKYVIDGGPHTGKTKSLESLAKRGYETVEESARIIINWEKAKQKVDPSYIPILPETHLEEFQYLLYPLQLKLESNIKSNKPVLDRSLVTGIAYMELGGIKVPEGYYDLIKSANYTKILFLEQLPFYQKDEARWEDESQAKIIHNKIYEVYTREGYDTTIIPFLEMETEEESIEARTDFMEKNVLKKDYYKLKDKLYLKKGEIEYA
tara:strand:+ start:1890 stop:2510 length:621 start_codon:yes stop_codon:yes gene_type:complete